MSKGGKEGGKEGDVRMRRQGGLKRTTRAGGEGRRFKEEEGETAKEYLNA
jgi:hypothetical protein